ncbi:MAG TPA: hypothetical protein VL263_21785 [Vicinamibacterales bacterium]|jgi:hypothetical protein|nr:hypothetical protein [Vicinamibacterales bacterium]
MSQLHDDEAVGKDRPRPGVDREIEAVHRRLDALDRRLEQRLAEIRVKQEEELMLIKAMSCQLRGRVERADRRGSRAG